MEMTSCLFRKDVLRPRSVSARCWDARGGKTHPRPVPGSPLLEHTPCHTPRAPPPQHTHSTHHGPQTLPLHTNRSPYILQPLSLTHTNTYEHMSYTTPSHTHISHKHIRTCHNDSIHASTTCLQIHKHPEKHLDACGHSLPRHAGSCTSQRHSGGGRAVEVGRKL